MMDSINAATITIDPKTPGGLHGAIDSADNGDTIQLKNGVYTIEDEIGEYGFEPKLITKSITIKGLGSNVVLDGRKSRYSILEFLNPAYLSGGTRVNRVATLENLKFIDNRKDTKQFNGPGAAVVASAYDKLTVKNCVFTNNRGAHGGIYFAGDQKRGSLTVSKCTFQGNKASHIESGSAIRMESGSLTVDKSTFKSNIGATIALVDSTAKITNSKFEKNTGGPAIYIPPTKYKITVSGCTFTNNNNKAQYGGAISIAENHHPVKIVNCKFTKNNAAYGGAISSVSRGKYTVSGSTFTSNKAIKKGGAVYMPLSTATITNSKFTKNIVGKKYNAIYKDKSYKLTKKNVKITPKDGTKVKK